MQHHPFFYDPFFHPMAVMGWLGFLIMFTAILVSLFLYSLLYRRIKKTFDPLFFNLTYYSEGELAFYMAFPFRFLRPATYIGGMIGPSMHRKRFRNVNMKQYISKFTYRVCVLFVFCNAILFAGLVLMLAGYFFATQAGIKI